MARTQIEVKVAGMDCAECTEHVQSALAALPGVEDVRVLLSSEKAVLQVDPTQVDLPTIRRAVEGAGYTVPDVPPGVEEATSSRSLVSFTRPILTLFGLVFGAVLLVVIAGEWLGLFERVTDLVPWYLGWGLVLLAGYPIFWNVIRTALRRQVISHTVIVRPGESIPVDGDVTSGQATVNQAAITGESLPVEVGAGNHVFAATLAQLGSIRVRVSHVGADTTFGRVITMVEEAEAHRAPVQRIADRFSAYFLPVVATIALVTLVVSRNPLAAAAVLVVACSCSFALATPIAMLASIGAAASRGLLVKGGKYLELLARAEVLLIDKTGTITAGRPQITDVNALPGHTEAEVLTLAASAERYSEHPLAEAVRERAAQERLLLHEPAHFKAIPGLGIRAE